MQTVMAGDKESKRDFLQFRSDFRRSLRGRDVEQRITVHESYKDNYFVTDNLQQIPEFLKRRWYCIFTVFVVFVLYRWYVMHRIDHIRYEFKYFYSKQSYVLCSRRKVLVSFAMTSDKKTNEAHPIGAQSGLRIHQPPKK